MEGIHQTFHGTERFYYCCCFNSQKNWMRLIFFVFLCQTANTSAHTSRCSSEKSDMWRWIFQIITHVHACSLFSAPKHRKITNCFIISLFFFHNRTRLDKLTSSVTCARPCKQPCHHEHKHSAAACALVYLHKHKINMQMHARMQMRKRSPPYGVTRTATHVLHMC